MSFKILIMGLPGAGKSTLAKSLVDELSADWINADAVRTKYNDWDFSHDGRIRQVRRITELADQSTSTFVVADFVAALEEQRVIFNPDFIVWMNTITESRYEDTNRAFEPPTEADVQFDRFDEVKLEHILRKIQEIL